MKKYLLLSIVLFLVVNTAFSQEKVRERDILGEWQLVIDIDEDEIEDELEEESYFARAFASAISGFVIDIVEDIDIRMIFQKDNKLDIIVEVWGEEEVEEAEWYITRDGELVIDDDDHDDEVWLFDGDVLVSYDKRGSKYKRDKEEVYMKRIR